MTIIEVQDRHREWYGDLIRIILSLETLAITIASRTETNSLLHVLLGVQWWARMLMNAAAIAAILILIEALFSSIAGRVFAIRHMLLLILAFVWATFLFSGVFEFSRTPTITIMAAFNFVLSVGVAFIDTVHRSIESGR